MILRLFDLLFDIKHVTNITVLFDTCRQSRFSKMPIYCISRRVICPFYFGTSIEAGRSINIVMTCFKKPTRNINQPTLLLLCGLYSFVSLRNLESLIRMPLVYILVKKIKISVIDRVLIILLPIKTRNP